MATVSEYQKNKGLGRIGVKSGSAYAKFNGQCFPIVEKIGNRISLNINGQTTDFYGCEVSVFTAALGWVGYELSKQWNIA